MDEPNRAEQHALDVRYETRVEGVRKVGDGFAVALTRGGEVVEVTAKVVLVATGLCAQKPCEPAWDGVKQISYCDLEADLSCYDGLNVGIVGGGNSAFEVASLLKDHAAQTYVLPRSDVRFAHETHYPGDVRSKHLGFLDQFYLKSMDAILPPRYANGVLGSEKAKHDHVLAPPRTPPPNGLNFYGLRSKANQTTGLFFDVVVNCGGFYPDLSFLKDVLDPLPEKYPELTPFGESDACSNLFFLGTLAHGRDARTSSGGFIHGFRYLVKTGVSYLRQRRHGDCAISSADELRVKRLREPV